MIRNLSKNYIFHLLKFFLIFFFNFLFISDIQKEFRVVPKSVQASLGDSVYLQCVGPKAQPEASIRWLKNGQPFIDLNGLNQQTEFSHSSSSFIQQHLSNDENSNGLHPSDSERFKLLSGGLRIFNVQPRDNGRYSCVAENFVDTRESPPALLTVYGKFKH